MITLIYATISVTFLVLVAYLLQRPRPADSEESLLQKGCARTIGNGSWLNLSERIFDPSDARWLADELAFPKLAKSLTLERKRLAIRWLEALQASFEDLVRTPASVSSGAPEGPAADGWRMLWLTVRFKLLVSYALLVVKLCGPYHRLIPSFSWVPLSTGGKRSFGRAALAANRNSE